MSDTPATPVPTSPIATIEKDLSWIKTHFVLSVITVVLIVGSIFGGITVFEDIIERHDERVAAAQQAKLGVDTATQAALLQELAQDRTANAQRDATQAALIQSLISQMKQQHAATDKQVATDATLDAKSAAARLASQTKASPADVTATNDSVSLTLPVARTVVTDLDLLPQAQADVTNLQGQLGAQQILTTDAKTEAAAASAVIVADKAELIQTIKADGAACNVRVDAQAAKDRKRGFWATLAGFAGGILLGSRF